MIPIKIAILESNINLIGDTIIHDFQNILKSIDKLPEKINIIDPDRKIQDLIKNITFQSKNAKILLESKIKNVLREYNFKLSFIQGELANNEGGGMILCRGVRDNEVFNFLREKGFTFFKIKDNSLEVFLELYPTLEKDQQTFIEQIKITALMGDPSADGGIISLGDDSPRLQSLEMAKKVLLLI